jgi:hypothetical protein
MKEKFEVIEIENQMMKLKVNRSSGCHSCSANGGCGTGILAKYFDHYSVFNKHVVKLIGQAIGSESIAKGERGVVIGRDGRLSGVELMSALKEGLKSTGCHVVDIGMVPTPLSNLTSETTRSI